MESRLKEIIIFVSFLFVIILLGTAFKSFYPSLTGNVVLGNNVNNEEVTSAEEKVLISKDEMKVNYYGNLAVFGIIENIADTKLNYVEIQAKFYDFEHNILESRSKSISDLEVGEKWRFEVVYPNADLWRVVSYEIKLGEVA